MFLFLIYSLIFLFYLPETIISIVFHFCMNERENYVLVLYQKLYEACLVSQKNSFTVTIYLLKEVTGQLLMNYYFSNAKNLDFFFLL